MSEETVKTPESSNFIEDIIREELAEGGRCHGRAIQTRFPPEPNGYLHIGHAKALCIDFGMAEKFGGECHLRMDDTNPTKEDVEYVDAIQEDIHWLGYDWGKHFYYASDYFEKMYELAVGLIRKGLAYVCQLTPEQMRENRGDLSRPAVSPYRDRPVEESLDLFARMRAGEFPDGSMTLRAQRQFQHARSGHLPHQSRPPSSSRGQMVRLSHVRFRPPHRGHARRDHPLPLLPGV